MLFTVTDRTLRVLGFKKCIEYESRSTMMSDLTGQLQIGKVCIEVSPFSKSASIPEKLCIGYRICVKRCPFEAVTTHHYGKKSFTVRHLLTPWPRELLGLAGQKSIGIY
uniref:4Fe-4S ferredoxin-type domain-containing protein n=1 Tax=Glossina austeni TaxID=7395 RepID=A0A1A9VX63_GLOAU